MITIDKISFAEYVTDIVEHYPLEVNGILVEHGNRFGLKGTSFLSKEDIDVISKAYDDNISFQLGYGKSKNQYLGSRIPIESTQKNLEKLAKEGEIIRGILHAHTWQERADESSFPLLTLIKKYWHDKHKHPMATPELSNNDIKTFDEISEKYATSPVYYGILNVPNVPKTQIPEVIMGELDKRLLFLESGKILMEYKIKE